jgi:RNA polymerase sigma-70 factor (ECF subfamily)
LDTICRSFGNQAEKKGENDDMTNSDTDRSETHLWLAFREGHKEAFSRLYETYYRKLYAYGIRIGMDDAQVRDAIQDISLKLYTNPEAIVDASTLLSFLFRSVRNYFTNIYKKESARVHIEDSMPFSLDYTIEQHIIAEEEREALTAQIQEMLSCLTPRQKEVIYFRFLYEMEYEEIAEIMHISPHSARNALYKAFEKIRKNYPPHALSLLLFLFLC